MEKSKRERSEDLKQRNGQTSKAKTTGNIWKDSRRENFERQEIIRNMESEKLRQVQKYN